MFVKDENLQTVSPSAVECRRCKHALETLKIKNHIIDRSNYANCEVYKMKPYDILWNEAHCEFFEEK